MQRTTDLNLPDYINLKNYGGDDGDLLVSGPDLTPELYSQIRENLPPALRSRLIGWRATARRIA